MLAVDVAAGGPAADGLLLGLTVVGAIEICAGEAMSAARGSDAGWTTGTDGLREPELGDGFGCLLRDGLGVADGADDGVAEGEAEGVADGVAVGEAEGAGVVAVGAGVVGVADGDGSAVGAAGDGLGATVVAAATPTLDEQMTAATAPAVMTPRRNRPDIRPPCLDHRT